MKATHAKVKGRETENALIRFLKSYGLKVERRRLTGSADQGDVTGWPGVCVEIKSAAQWQPIEWLRQLDAEAENSKAETGFVAARPKGKPDPEDWVAIIRLPWLMELMREAGWLPDDVLVKTLATMRSEALVRRAFGPSPDEAA